MSATLIWIMGAGIAASLALWLAEVALVSRGRAVKEPRTEPRQRRVHGGTRR